MTAPIDLFNKWVERLRLTDWDIHLHIVPPSYFTNEDGCNHYNDQEKSSDIFISERSSNSEETLVHELLHLHFSSIETPPGSAALLCIERGINVLAKLLVSYERGERD